MSREGALHEDLEREAPVRTGSDRSFGLTIGAVLSLMSGFSFWRHAQSSWWLAAAIAFTATGLFAPSVLGPLNRTWLRLGFLMHRIVSPLVLGLVFLAVVTPMGLLMRALGKRPLSLGIRRGAQGSYWIERDPPGPARDSYRNQF